MFSKPIFLFFIGLIVVSCKHFEKETQNIMLHEIDTIVDFSTVDAFPLFEQCAEIPSREKQQICFQLTMSQHIYALLKAYQFEVNEEISDTVLVKLKIDKLGVTSLSEIKSAELTKALLPQFDSILRVILNDIPVLKPAIKRNMPVTTEFTLPIILKNKAKN
jgi:hypothetical protein